MCVYCGGTLKEATMDYVEKLTTMLLSLKMSPVKNAINAAKNIFLPRPQKKNLMIWQLKYLIYCNDRNMALLSIQAFAKEKEEHCEP